MEAKSGRGLVQEDIDNVTKLLENQQRRHCDDDEYQK